MCAILISADYEEMYEKTSRPSRFRTTAPPLAEPDTKTPTNLVGCLFSVVGFAGVFGVGCPLVVFGVGFLLFFA